MTNYTETFYPIVKMVTVRNILSIIVAKGWNPYLIDVNNAFLQEHLEKEVHMEIPRECFQSSVITISEKNVCTLLKFLYGHKQASRQWNINLTKSIILHVYKKTKHDYLLFDKYSQGKSVHASSCLCGRFTNNWIR